jgi:hypothetical protein
MGAIDHPAGGAERKISPVHSVRTGERQRAHESAWEKEPDGTDVGKRWSR